MSERDSFHVEVLLRFGAWKGCIVEFSVEVDHLPRSMRLILEGWCSFTCHNVKKLEEAKIDTSFHFLPALETGDFHDFIIKSRSGKEFPVHKTLLAAEKINTTETYLKSVLFGFSDEVTITLLHYLYSQSLPHNLSPATASQVIEFARNQPNFSRLGQLCQHFVKNSSFQSELAGLVKEMRDALNSILSMLGGKLFDDEGRECGSRNKSFSRSLGSNPAKMCSVIKQAITQILLVVLKVIYLYKALTLSVRFCVTFKPINS